MAINSPGWEETEGWNNCHYLSNNCKSNAIVCKSFSDFLKRLSVHNLDCYILAQLDWDTSIKFSKILLSTRNFHAEFSPAFEMIGKNPCSGKHCV